MKRLDCEYHLRPGEGSFRTGTRGPVSEPVCVDPKALQALKTDPEAYGILLFNMLFPPGGKLLVEYRSSEIEAKDSSRNRRRFRLYLDPALDERVRELVWEWLYDFERGDSLSRSSRIAFSRYLPVNGTVSAPAPSRCRPRALIAVADAPDLERLHRLPSLDRESSQRSLKRSFRRLWWRISCGLLKGYVTLNALRERLQIGRFNVLHLIAHGLPPTQGGAGLMLQNEDGWAEIVRDKALAEACCDSQELRLVVLAVCHSAAARRDEPFRDLPGRLIQQGVPAVVGMRREISVSAAELFTRAFYRALAKSGEADAAANEARRRLYLDTEGHDHWSDPVLFLAEMPWRKSRCPVIAAVGLAAALALVGALYGLGREEPPHPPEPAPTQTPQLVSTPPLPPPTLQVTRVAGLDFMEGPELEVPPSGDIEGTIQGPAETYTIQAVSYDRDSSSTSEPAVLEASPGRWILHDFPFRTLLNRGETHAQITVTAGSVSKGVHVKAPAPEVEIETVCGRPANWFQQGCDRFIAEGTARGVLEQQEKVWVEVQSRRNGDFWQRCLVADVLNGRWRVEGDLGDGGRGSMYQLRAGLVERAFQGRDCPQDPLIERTFP